MEETNQNKRYGTLLIDPPWDVHQTGSRGAVQHYKLMTLEQIKRLPVASLAAENSHCWLWVTNAALRDGYDVLESFGYIPRSVLTWCKPRIGLGNKNSLRNSTEHLLFGTRGNAPVAFKGQPTWTFAPCQKHSHKPEEQYAIIERISQPPYLELFARRRQPGWDVWGDEVESDIAIEGYPVPKLSPKGVAFAKNARLSGSNKGKSESESEGEGEDESLGADKGANAGGKNV